MLWTRDTTVRGQPRSRAERVRAPWVEDGRRGTGTGNERSWHRGGGGGRVRAGDRLERRKVPCFTPPMDVATRENACHNTTNIFARTETVDQTYMEPESNYTSGATISISKPRSNKNDTRMLNNRSMWKGPSTTNSRKKMKSGKNKEKPEKTGNNHPRSRAPIYTYAYLRFSTTATPNLTHLADENSLLQESYTHQLFSPPLVYIHLHTSTCTYNHLHSPSSYYAQLYPSSPTINYTHLLPPTLTHTRPHNSQEMEKKLKQLPMATSPRIPKEHETRRGKGGNMATPNYLPRHLPLPPRLPPHPPPASTPLSPPPPRRSAQT